jgi:hypothetical protein
VGAIHQPITATLDILDSVAEPEAEKASGGEISGALCAVRVGKEARFVTGE